MHIKFTAMLYDQLLSLACDDQREGMTFISFNVFKNYCFLFLLQTFEWISRFSLNLCQYNVLCLISIMP